MPIDPSLYTTLELDLLNRMGSSSNGLTAEQAEKLLKEVGPNTVAAGGRKSLVMDLLHRCKNPLVIQLLVMCALFYWAADDPASASIVGAMVFLSVFLSYFQESRSSRAVEKLQKMVKTTVTVALRAPFGTTPPAASAAKPVTDLRLAAETGDRAALPTFEPAAFVNASVTVASSA